jgi:hypothetical protein
MGDAPERPVCPFMALSNCYKPLLAIRHYTDLGDSGSAFFEAELLLVWLFSLLYYRKQKMQFN